MIRTWEDRLNPASCAPEVAANAAAWREQQAMIEAIRNTIADVPRTKRRYTPAPKPKPVPVPKPKAVKIENDWPQDRVMRLRKDLQMSQRELADVLRVRKNTVSRWELGLRSPKHGAVKDELLALEQRVKARKVIA